MIQGWFKSNSIWNQLNSWEIKSVGTNLKKFEGIQIESKQN